MNKIKTLYLQIKGIDKTQRILKTLKRNDMKIISGIFFLGGIGTIIQAYLSPIIKVLLTVNQFAYLVGLFCIFMGIWVLYEEWRFERDFGKKMSEV